MNIYLFGTIGKAQTVISELIKGIEARERNITLYINSGGGKVGSMAAITDLILSVNPDITKITTFCTGIAYSAAATILAAGHKRIATKHSRIMIHQAWKSLYGGYNSIELQEKMEELQMSQDICNKLLSQLTKQPLEKIKKDTEKDFYMTAEEALAYSIIDEIQGVIK
ncbi:MAG: ATP-dependent Clp protease proteolytic subunit [Campylobacteraceae bacterium]|jgi:ATP-dependent Clp protease protease subunit|nr:ATP-dependent Clp protease proteolytic subunit [Campylobacteraceae bacterium]